MIRKKEVLNRTQLELKKTHKKRGFDESWGGGNSLAAIVEESDVSQKKILGL